MTPPIGVAVTTFNRPEMLAESLERVARHSKGARILVSDDSSDPEALARNREICAQFGVEHHVNPLGRGIARNKNHCLRLLQDCQHVFLLDDDAYPIKDGWLDWYIEASRRTGIQHLTYNPQDGLCNSIFAAQRMLIEEAGVKLTTAYMSSGVLLYYTQRALRTAGGFNPAFGAWGHEHVEFGYRIHNFGLTRGLGPFLSLHGDDAWFFSHDFSTPRFHGLKDIRERAALAAEFEHILEENKNRRLFCDFKGHHVGRIPRVIHQIWVGDQSRRPTRLMEGWRAAHPDWKYEFWDDARIESFRLNNLTAYRASATQAGKADIARYEILHRLGGWFIDADSLCLRPIPDALTSHGFVANRESVALPLLANGVFGAEPGSRYLDACIARIARTPRRAFGVELAWVISGPALFTEEIKALASDDLLVLPPNLFLPEHHSSPALERDLAADPDKLRARYPDALAYQFWGTTHDSYRPARTAP